MKKLIFQIILLAALLTPAVLKSQSNITVDVGAAIEIQTGADICADTWSILGNITGGGTRCGIPLTPVAPILFSPTNNIVAQLLSLNLVWQKSLGAVTYRVQLSTDSLFGTLIVNDSTITDSTRAVSGLLPLTYYWWRANAKGVGGTSTFTAAYKFRTLGYPNQISLISPINNSVNLPASIIFVWSKTTEQTEPFTAPFTKPTTQPFTQSGVFGKVTGKSNDGTKSGDGIDAISNYWFDMVTDTVSLANLVRDTTLIDTTKSLSGLNNLTNYYWRVRAKNQIGWGSYSLWYKFTTIIAAPPPPLLVSPANNAVGQNLSLTLVWNKSSTATNYRVQLSTDSLFTGLIVNDSTLIDSTRIISGLNPLTSYWWRVNSKNIGGTSSFSTVFKFRTLGTPFNITLVSPSNNAVNQPVSLTCVWRRAVEQTAPFTMPFTKPTTQPFSQSGVFGKVTGKSNDGTKSGDGIDAISNYWFDMVTDTVSLANLLRDTTLIDTTKSVSGLSNTTNYYWRVKAKNQIGWGSYSAWYKFTTIIAAPAPPLLVSPANNAIGQNLSLTLVWNKSSTATNYRVQVATDSLFTSLIINDSTLIDSTRIISGLNPLTYYWWRVNSKNIGGISSYSAVWRFKTLGSPFSVNLISPANNATNQSLSISFIWSRAIEQTTPFEIKQPDPGLKDNIDGISNYWYDLVTDTVSLANLLRDTTLIDTTKSVSGLSNTTNYYWRVRAKNQIGWGSFSVWYKFTTITAAPPPPLLVSPANNAVGQNLSLTLVWNKSAGATNYRVQVATDSLFSGLIVNDSTLIDSTRTISGLNPLTYYWWRVNSKNIGGTSGYSAVFKFRTIGSPFSVTLVSPVNNSLNQPISLTCIWHRAIEQTAPFVIGKPDDKQKNEIDAVSNYWFDMVTDTVSLSNLLRDTTLTDTTKAVGGLNYQTSYFWRVKAKNQVGWGNFSVWFKFTTIPQPPALVNLTVIPGGLYNTSSDQLNMKDTVRIILVDSLTGTKIDSAKAIIDSVTFATTSAVSFSLAQTGRYYIYVFHRNHVPVASAYTYGITRGITVNYDFTDAATKTYANNVIQVSASPLRYGMIPGDANSDQYVDGLDQTIWIGLNGLGGFYNADFNGDGYVDGLDQTLWIINNGLGSILPWSISFNNPGTPTIKNVNPKINTTWNTMPKIVIPQKDQNKQKTINK